MSLLLYQLKFLKLERRREGTVEEQGGGEVRFDEE